MIIGGITLPNPEYNDARKIGGKLNILLNMNGVLHTTKVARSTTRLEFTCNNVKMYILESLVAYIASHVGSAVTLVDWFGVSWSGVILTDPNTLTVQGRIQGITGVTGCTGDELGSVTLEFEGVRI